MIKINPVISFTICSAFLLCATSCADGPVFEKEGDCSPKVQFVFKKHRQALHSISGREQDVFYSTVGSVHLFIYDTATGELVFEKSESTDLLNSAAELNMGNGTDRCYMPIDLKPGKYRMIAWCGLDETGSNNAFRLTDNPTRTGFTHCEVKRNDATGHPINLEKYEGLYHGIVREVEISYEGGVSQIIPIELTKDNNEITVMVQHNNHTFSEGEYEVVYTDANGTMHFEDNSLTNPNRLEYHPHTTSLLTSSTEYNGSTVEAGALVAHLSTSRLIKGNSEDARLEVRSRDGRTVFSIPFIKYMLNMQTLTNDGQYYLDCEDTYNCSFYLTGDTQDDNGLWMASMIIINNWVVVPQQSSDL